MEVDSQYRRESAVRHLQPTRRELLQVGYSGLLGLGMSQAVSGRNQLASAAKVAATSSGNRPKQVVIVFLTGAASHHETFDMKPDATAKIRGDFNPIATKIPGYGICEHLPHLAARADKYSVIRTLSHKDNNHLMSTPHVLPGEKQPGGFFDKVASRDDWPDYAARCAFLRPRNDGIPTGVNLPSCLMHPPLTWTGPPAGSSRRSPQSHPGNAARTQPRCPA